MKRYGETKVYFDGSHYIAIPHTERKIRPRPKPKEEFITVEEPSETTPEERDNNSVESEKTAPISSKEGIDEQVTEEITNEPSEPKQRLKKAKQMTKKELFNRLYDEYINLKKAERRKKIIAAMLTYFDTERDCEFYVDMNFVRKQRNLICRRIRMARKASLVDFNYFCTFTYDGEKHTEESFKKKLKICFRNLCNRKKWKYMGVWERSPKKKRLHFHGLFYISEGSMPGEIIQKRDYSLSAKKMKNTFQNTYFNEKFGRSDFEPIDDHEKLGSALTYLTKYIEKTGEKIVYSKGLYQYFISDIMDDDIICPIGMEDKKLLLYDDFRCIDEGTILGKVSKDTIRLMRKSN